MCDEAAAKVAFLQWAESLPMGSQQIIGEAMKRGESVTFNAWMESWRQASLIPQTDLKP